MAGRSLKRWLIWCLVALSPWLSLGMAERQFLGPLHSHPTQPEMTDRLHSAVLRGAVTTWLNAQAKAGTVSSLAHTHADWERHHHAPATSSFLALDAGADEPGAQGHAAPWLPLGQAGAGADWTRLDASSVAAGWQRLGAESFRSLTAMPLRRPPRA